MNGKSAAAASRSHRGTGGAVANMIVQRRLSHHFGHPFKVWGVKGRRNISWAFGPLREKVWAMIVCEFPELAVEGMASALAVNDVDIENGYFAFPIPSWVKRQDFFNATVDEFPGLVMQGGDPNESDSYGNTPLDYAVGSGNSARAAALIKAGAVFEQYGPDGWQRQTVVGMPEVIAAMESAHLEQVTAMAFAEQRAPVRL